MSTSGIDGIACERIATALRNKLGLTDQQAYVSAAAAYIDGQPEFVVQVIPGSISVDGAGDGSQDGGSLVRRGTFTLAIWWRVKLDQHQMSEQALIEAEVGLMDQLEIIRNIFSCTNLGSLDLTQLTGTPDAVFNADIMKYMGESPTVWFDYDRGVLSRQMNFSGAWGVVLPSSVSLVNADFAICTIDGNEGQTFNAGSPITGTYQYFTPTGAKLVSGSTTHAIGSFSATGGAWSGIISSGETAQEWQVFLTDATRSIFAGVIGVA